MRHAAIVVAVALALSAANAAASGRDTFEIWALDQSNSPGLAFGGTVYVYDGADLARGHAGDAAVPEKIDLGGASASLCMTRTGANPVRPHMIAINSRQTHAVISFVASGHVVFIDAASRMPVECLQSTVGSTGVRQVHFARPAPNDRYIGVANQNGKLYERIDTNYATNTFVLDPANSIDLATCTTPNGMPCQAPDIRPDNAPICPVIDATSRFNFVTLRGGGLFVVDGTTSPMSIVAEYDDETVRPNGCLGALVGNKIYIGSGGGTPTHLSGADLYAFPATGFSALNPPNTPAPVIVFREDEEDADAHGATMTKHQRYLWVADRGRNFLWVVDTETDAIVNRIPLAGAVSDDPTPDLMVTAPNGSHVFVSLRGPNPLSGDPHVSTGSTPGVGVLKVLDGGRNGIMEAVARVSNIDAGGVERADVHGLALRRK